MKFETRKQRASEIEDAAFALLEEHGFEGFSMQTLAKLAKASNETLYNWYGGKTGLLEALIRANSNRTGLVIEKQEGDPASRLLLAAPAFLEVLLDTRTTALSQAAAADKHGTLGRVLAREDRTTIAPKVVELLRDAVEAHYFTGTPEEMAEIWYSLLVGDLQVRRTTGALAMPNRAYITARAAASLRQLRKLFPSE